MTNDGSTAFSAGPKINNSLFYMGNLMSVLAGTEQTNDAFSIMEYCARPGGEPPPHLHIDQDEVFYVLEGELEVYTPDITAVRVGAGELLFLPRNQAHAWYITSPAVRGLVMTNPAGLDHYFAAMAEPATSMDLPPHGITYAMDDPAHAVEVGMRYGIKILSPEETAELLPDYPGFGAVRKAA